MENMENKKTTVEQMAEFFRDSKTAYLYSSVVNEWIKTFLEKEKQQIIDAYNSGSYMCSVSERLDYDETVYKYKNAEEYYNQLKK